MNKIGAVLKLNEMPFVVNLHKLCHVEFHSIDGFNFGFTLQYLIK